MEVSEAAVSHDFTKPLTWDHSGGQCYADPPHHTTFSKMGNEVLDTDNSVQESMLGHCRVNGIRYDLRYENKRWRCKLWWLGCAGSYEGWDEGEICNKQQVLEDAYDNLMMYVIMKFDSRRAVDGKLICKECIDQSSVIAPMWFMFPHRQGKCSHCEQEKECVAIPVPDKQPTDTEIEVTASDRQDAIKYVYANDWRVRLLIRRSVHNQLRLSQIAESVLKTCKQRNATQNTEDIQAKCESPLKDAVTFWPVVIQLLLSVIIRLIIDYFINKQATQPQP